MVGHVFYLIRLLASVLMEYIIQISQSQCCLKAMSCTSASDVGLLIQLANVKTISCQSSYIDHLTPCVVVESGRICIFPFVVWVHVLLISCNKLAKSK